MDQLEITVYAALFLLSAVLLYTLLTSKRRRPSSPPGPFSLPIIGHLHLLGPRLHRSFHDLSQRYGPLMQLRLGSATCVVVSSPELTKEFLRTNELVFAARNHSTVVDTISYNASFAFSAYGPYWKYIKKLCTNELLSTRNLNHFLPIRKLEVMSFLEILMEKGKSGESFNVSQELAKLTFNVISRMMLSIRCSGKGGDAETATTVIRQVMQIFGEFDIADVVCFCKNSDLQGMRKRSVDIHQRYDALLEKIITEREKLRRSQVGGGDGGDEARDFLDMLLDIVESGNSEVNFTRKNMKALILDFFSAGTDTTAIAIEWAIAELMNNPSVLKKAQKEIDEVVGSDRLVRESDGPNLPYLQAIIKETFRLHPSVPMIPRISVSDCVIDGYKIPTNTLVFINNWSMGRNPKYWDNPLLFKPERFLEKEKASIDIKGQHFELLPFGSGRRGCPGMLLAIKEMTVIIGAVIQCFDWKLPDGLGQVDIMERGGLTAPPENNLICRVELRVDPTTISDAE